MGSLLRSPVFDRLRRRYRDNFSIFIERTVRVVEGDMERECLGLSTEDFDALSTTTDVILHCAALVKWSSPLDVSMRSNALGSQRIAQLALAGRMAGREVHIVLVSTAFVHGRRTGQCPEHLVHSDDDSFNAAGEVEVCLRRAAEVDAEASTPVRRAEFHRMSRQRLGPQADKDKLDGMAADLRRRWVQDTMTRWGEARAQRWGWNDCYTFSKVVGEHLAAQVLSDVPYSIVRPSGIVAATKEPAPGWIDAYLLVEPLIEGVGRGQITSFPGDPRCVIDCVPVDFVCNAILSAAAKQPPSAGPHVYQCASGDIYPNTLANIEATWIEYFKRDPMLDSRGQPPRLNPIQYHVDLDGFARGMRRRYLMPLSGVTSMVELFPGWENFARLRDARGWLTRKRRTVEKVLDLASLYSNYTLNEWVFETANTRAMMAGLSKDDQQRFPYFPIVGKPEASQAWDWAEFWTKLHIPGMRHWVLRDKPSPPGLAAFSKL